MVIHSKDMSSMMVLTAIAVTIIGGTLLADAQLEPDIEDLRQKSLSEGKIFDEYLIPFTMSPANVEYFGGVEQAEATYTHFNDLLNASIGNKHMEVRNGLTMLQSNFHTLTDIAEPMSSVAALVIQERIQNGTYVEPDLEPLVLLHEYLIAEYPDENAGRTLTIMLGDMKALAPNALDLVEKIALFGTVDPELFDSNPHYWITMRWYGGCVFVDVADDCDKYLDEAREPPTNKSTQSSDVSPDSLPTPPSLDGYAH